MCDAPLPHSRGRRPRRPVALLLANYAVGWPAPLAAVLRALILLGSAWGTTPQSPAVTAPLQGSQSCGQALRQITSCHLPQSPGTVKTVPYSVFYGVRQTRKQPVGRDAPSRRGTLRWEQTLQKPVGRGHMTPPKLCRRNQRQSSPAASTP